MHVFLAWACAEKALFLGQKALLPSQNTLFLTRFAAILKKSSCWVKKRFLNEKAEICAFSPNGGNVAHPECPGIADLPNALFKIPSFQLGNPRRKWRKKVFRLKRSKLVLPLSSSSGTNVDLPCNLFIERADVVDAARRIEETPLFPQQEQSWSYRQKHKTAAQGVLSGLKGLTRAQQKDPFH